MSRSKVTVMYPPGLPFRFMRQRPQQLMIELAKLGHKAVFCQQVSGPYGSLINIVDDPYVSSPGIHENFHLCYNSIRYRREHEDETIIMLSSSGPHHVDSDYKPFPYAFIYDECDNFPNHDREAIIACKKADRILYSARSLKNIIDNRRKTSPDITDKMTFVPNACEFDFFDLPIKTSAEFTPPYNVMYMGAFAAWLDWELIIQTVKALPQCRFWFIGAEFVTQQHRGFVTDLCSLNNVAAVGHVFYDDLPFYMERADVLWIPFDVSQKTITLQGLTYPASAVTQHTNPIKFYEYLAMGKPIVHTPMVAVEDFVATEMHKAHNVVSASTAEEHIEAISSFTFWPGLNGMEEYAEVMALGKYHKEIAKKNTWASAAAQIDEVIQDIMSSDLEVERTARKKRAEVAGNNDPNLKTTFRSVHPPTERKELL